VFKRGTQRNRTRRKGKQRQVLGSVKGAINIRSQSPKGKKDTPRKKGTGFLLSCESGTLRWEEKNRPHKTSYKGELQKRVGKQNAKQGNLLTGGLQRKGHKKVEMEEGGMSEKGLKKLSRKDKTSSDQPKRSKTP